MPAIVIIVAFLAINNVMHVTSQLANQNNSSTDAHHRRLQVRGSLLYMKQKKFAKADRMKRILSVIDKSPHVVGNDLKPEPWGAQHNPSGNAIFAVFINSGTHLSRRDALPFLGSLRNTGYKGDMVLALSPGYQDSFLDVVKESNVVVYTVQVECEAENSGEMCNYPERPEIRASVNMIRFYLYHYWASLYGRTRDMFGISNTH